MRSLTLVIGILFSALAGGTSASGIEQLGVFKDWTAYKFSEGGSDVCYIASQPTKSAGDYTQRGQVYWLVANRKALSKKDTSTFVPGYSFQADATITVEISGRSYTMFSESGETKNQVAWFRDADDSPAAKAMRAGAVMIVKGISSRGTRTTDEFSLSGFTAAHNMIAEACGL